MTTPPPGGPRPPENGAPAPWLLLSVLPPPPGEELLLVDALRRLGARAVEREGERFVALFPLPDDPDGLARRARAAIRASTGLVDPDPVWRWQSHAEWAERWRRELAPRRVTARITVAPTAPGPGNAPDAPDAAAPILLRLDPTLAFGTAEHPTTRACLRYLDEHVRSGDRVLDVGAGSGILAIAALRLGARRALAVEADPLACGAARANAAANGVADRLEVRELTVTPRRLRRLGRHDLVAANLEGSILLPLIPTLPRALAPGGRLLLSGLLRPERAAALEAARAAGLSLEWETAERGWWTAALARKRAGERARTGAG